MREQADIDSANSLPLQHLKPVTTVFVGLPEMAYRMPADPIMGTRSSQELALFELIRLDNWEQYRQRFGGFTIESFLPDAIYGYFSNGGASCYVVSLGTTTAPTSPLPTIEAYQRGFSLLADLVEPYLLVCPDLARQQPDSSTAVELMQQVQALMMVHCEEKKGCFAILDMPPELNAMQALAYRQSLEVNAAAALYYPWLLVPNLSDSLEKTKFVPPSGHIAGIFHRVQQEYGRILAPANELLQNTLDLARHVVQGEEDVLLANQVNCLRAVSKWGIRVWGCRSLRNDFIVVGSDTAPAQEKDPFSTRMPPLELSGLSTAVFIGITERATPIYRAPYSGELIHGESILNKPILINSWQAYTTFFGGFTEDAFLPDAVFGFFENGGKQCFVLSLQSVTESDRYPLPPLSAADYIGDSSGQTRTGLAAVEALDNIHLVVCPDLMLHYQDDPYTKQRIVQVQTAVIAHCEYLERIAFIDMPPGLNPQQAKEWRHYTLYDTSYAVTYYPWMDILDQANRRKRIPASGHIAGLYQRQSTQYGHHKPPANTQILGAVNLEYNLSSGEQDILVPIGVNCLRAFPGRGIRPWGTRTLSSDATFRYVHLRRLLNMIKSALFHGTSWTQFEKHAPALLRQVDKQITSFLEDLRSKGILVGDSPEEAFHVECDETINPLEKQQQGEVTIKVRIALFQPGRYHQFVIRQANSLRRLIAEIPSY